MAFYAIQDMQDVLHHPLSVPKVEDTWTKENLHNFPHIGEELIVRNHRAGYQRAHVDRLSPVDAGYDLRKKRDPQRLGDDRIMLLLLLMMNQDELIEKLIKLLQTLLEQVGKALPASDEGFFVVGGQLDEVDVQEHLGQLPGGVPLLEARGGLFERLELADSANLVLDYNEARPHGCLDSCPGIICVSQHLLVRSLVVRALGDDVAKHVGCQKRKRWQALPQIAGSDLQHKKSLFPYGSSGAVNPSNYNATRQTGSYPKRTQLPHLVRSNYRWEPLGDHPVHLWAGAALFANGRQVRANFDTHC